VPVGDVVPVGVVPVGVGVVGDVDVPVVFTSTIVVGVGVSSYLKSAHENDKCFHGSY
jgi:hypothetical protein